MNSKTLNIGMNRKAVRLWIEGSFLKDANFNKGDRYDVILNDDHSMTLTKNPDGKRKVAGTIDRPIIDLTGKNVLHVVNYQDVVSLSLVFKSIIIKKV